MIRRALLLSLAFAAAGSTVALAADLPPPAAPQTYYKAPPPPAPSWTGCYINGGGGGGLMTTNQNGETLPGGVPTTTAVDTGGQGWLAVGGAGCDYQFHLWNWDVVVGGFGDYDWMNLRGTSSFGLLGAGNLKESSAWAGGARAGVLAAPWVLVYGTGGYTGTHFNSVNFFNGITGVPTGSGLASQNLNGWFIGGGTEAELRWLMPGLFLRTEYRYSSYQPTDNMVITTATGAPAGLGGVRSTTYTQTIFTELVWRFNFNGAHW